MTTFADGQVLTAAELNSAFSGLATSSSLAASSGSSLVGFQPAGTGALATTTQSKLREVLSVKDFGAIGDGASHPANTVYSTLSALQVVYPFATSLYQELDWLAWQKALTNGGAFTSLPVTYKMSNGFPASQQSLTVISGHSWNSGNGAKLDFTASVAQTAITHYITGYNFAPTTSWANATIYTALQMIATTFSGAGAQMTDTSTVGQASFYQWGQQVTLLPGNYRAKCTFSATLGASYALGNGNGPYCTINFCASGPGSGANFSGRSASGTGLSGVLTGTVSETIYFDFQVTSATTSWLTFTAGGYGNFTVTYLDITNINLNACILETRDGAADHYPIPQPFGGVYILGGGVGNGMTGMIVKSMSNMDGNHARFQDLVITGHAVGVEPSDGAYLLEFSNCNIYGNGTNFQYEGGFNSGENFRFYGGGFSNSAIGINNPGGGEITMFGSALDYCTQAITNNAGRIELHGVHAEMNVPVTAGLPLFQCINGGSVEFFGGMFLGAGGVGTAPEPPVNLMTALSTLVFNGTEIYNLSSLSGVACSGPGSLRINGWRNTGNPNIGPTLLSNCAAMDILAQAGTFEPISGSPFLGLDATGINLQGGIYSAGTSPSQWNSSFHTVGISGSYARSGTKSLSVQKIFGGGTVGQMALIIPAKEGHDIIGEINFLFPSNVGTGTAQMYYRLFWSKVIGFDAYNRPIFDPQIVFKGETDITVPLSGSSTWQQRAISTMHTTDSSSATSGISPGAPTWATHLAVLIDMTALPAMTFYIDDFIANMV